MLLAEEGMGIRMLERRKREEQGERKHPVWVFFLSLHCCCDIIVNKISTSILSATTGKKRFKRDER
jgi:hypothetical protein